MKIETGDAAILILHTPREKIFGTLQEINAAGVFIRGLELDYFEEWTNALKSGEPYLPMQDYFFPMWRIERMSRDESAPGLPSMTEQFRQRTGWNLEDF